MRKRHTESLKDQVRRSAISIMNLKTRRLPAKGGKTRTALSIMNLKTRLMQAKAGKKPRRKQPVFNYARPVIVKQRTLRKRPAHIIKLPDAVMLKLGFNPGEW